MNATGAAACRYDKMERGSRDACPDSHAFFMSTPLHIPVMPDEFLRLLEPRPGQIVVDCTVGAGGHTRLLAEKVAPSGRVIGLDQDAAMLDLARPRLAGLPVTLL